MKKYKIAFLVLAVVALVSLAAVTGVVYASPQTPVTTKCSGGNNDSQQIKLQLDDQDQPWGNGVSNTWSALNMAPGQAYAFTGNFVGLSINTPSTAQVTCDYKDTKGIPDQMAQKMILTKCVYGGSLWSIDCLTGNWQIFAPANSGNSPQWKLTDVDKDGFITFYDLEKSPLNYLPLPNSSVTNSTKFQISVEFAPTAGNNLQSDSLNMNMYFTASSWDNSCKTGGISPGLMQLFLGQSVKLASTCTTVTSSLNPSNFGQQVIFTAKVTGTGGIPTGKVQFQIDGTNFGTPVNLTNGIVNSTPISTLSIGNHTVTVAYSGDSNYATSAGVLPGGQTVTLASKSTSTTVTSSLNPSYFGQSVTFSVKVTGSGGTPSGTVQFLIDGTKFGKAVALLSNGTATSGAITTLSVGTHAVTAVYSGDTHFTASTGSLYGGQKVRSKAVINWPYKPNPCKFGQICTFTVQIGYQGSGTPTGKVTFFDGWNSIGTCSLSGNGVASISTGKLTVGSHNITAVYNGDDNDDGGVSSAVNQVINR